MSKSEQNKIIGKVNDLFDAKELLESRCMQLMRELNEIKAVKQGDISILDANVLSYGRKKLFDECTYSFVGVKSTVNAFGTRNFQSFEDYRNAKTYQVPDFMSRDQFMEYFDQEFPVEYANDLEEEKQRIKTEENEPF